MLLLRRSRTECAASFSGIARCRDIHRRQISHKPEAKSTLAHLEVESKFNVTALLRAQLDGVDSHQQSSIFPAAATSLLKFTRQPNRFINDQYFDLDDALCSKGIWVRRRTERVLLSHDFPFKIENEESSKWEAKVRVGGDYQSSQFEELVGEKVVMDLAKQHVPNIASLRKVVDIDTFRGTWTVREHVERVHPDQNQTKTIVIDSSTAGGAVGRGSGDELGFRHVVGEVELTMDVEVMQDRAKDGGAKRAAGAVMKTQLDMFMDRHASLFPTRPAPVGKLSAYFAWKRQQEDHLR